mmetsp:Transcript_59984/g.165880  ORF Transcript_59984/g.165880 Transcript_59984/m.165880 type:complete len:277 (-) Transcript_59984:566-1396(-)
MARGTTCCTKLQNQSSTWHDSMRRRGALLLADAFNENVQPGRHRLRPKSSLLVGGTALDSGRCSWGLFQLLLAQQGQGLQEVLVLVVRVLQVLRLLRQGDPQEHPQGNKAEGDDDDSGELVHRTAPVEARSQHAEKEQRGEKCGQVQDHLEDGQPLGQPCGARRKRPASDPRHPAHQQTVLADLEDEPEDGHQRAHGREANEDGEADDHLQEVFDVRAAPRLVLIDRMDVTFLLVLKQRVRLAVLAATLLISALAAQRTWRIGTKMNTSVHKACEK